MRRGEHGFGNEALGSGVIDQKRILVVGLVSQPAAARLFPREFLVEQLHREAGRGQLFRGESSRRTATQNGDTFHFFLAGGGQILRRRHAARKPPPAAAQPFLRRADSARGAWRRHSASAVRSAGILAAHHHPLTVLLFAGDTSWTCPPPGPFGGDRHGGIGLVAVELNGGHLYVHRLYVQAGFGQVIDYALTHGIAILRLAGAAGQSQDQEESGGNSHISIIASECAGYNGRKKPHGISRGSRGWRWPGWPLPASPALK